MDRPRAFIIAGPNGAGKSTFAPWFLPSVGVQTFLNADHIATGLSPFAPEAAALPAGKLLLQEMREVVEARADFAVETTLAGRGYVRHVRDWQQAGYAVHLYFLRLSTAAAARRRVARRIREGGHSIPPDVIDRRHELGWANFLAHFRSRVDHWGVYDADADPARPVDFGSNPNL